MENDEKIKCYLNTNLVLYLNLIYHFVFPKIEPYNIFSPIAFGELNESQEVNMRIKHAQKHVVPRNSDILRLTSRRILSIMLLNSSKKDGKKVLTFQYFVRQIKVIDINSTTF